MDKINLQLFAEGAEAATGASEQSESTADEQATGSVSEQESDNSETETLQTDGKDERKSFSELIRGEYKDDFTEEVNRIFSQRYKGEKSFENKYNALRESFLPLMERFDAKDPEELIEKISGDEKRLSEEAMEHGMDTEDYKRFLALRADNRRKTEYIERMEAEREAQRRAKAHDEQITKWNKEAEAVREEYPEFDLAEEVKNKSFLTALRMGVELKDAFRIAHPDVYKRQIAESERKAAYLSAKAKTERPKENGTGGIMPTREVSDVGKLTDEQMDEIRKRVMAGEKISFS